MVIDFIADLHGNYPELAGGDLLIVAGDLTGKHTTEEYGFFKEWFYKQSYRKKILIAGNHDTFLYCNQSRFTPDSWFSYLEDSGNEFNGLKIWGSPWTKTFPRMNPNCKAFTVNTEEELEEKWNKIPEDIDILITHSPPFGILDTNAGGDNCGSVTLRNKVLDGTLFKNLKYHIFGHIHECGGRILDLTTTKFINASHVNERYKAVNNAIRIEI